MRSIFKIYLFGLLVSTLITSAKAASPVDIAELEKDWKEIQSILKDCIGVYEGQRPDFVTTGLPDGPLLGNGDIGIVCNGTGSSQKFYITSVNFWDGRYTLNPGKQMKVAGSNWGSTGIKSLPIGGVTIHQENGSGSDIVQYQDMLNAEIRTEAGVKIKTWLTATDQIMVSELMNDSKKPVSISVETWTKNDPLVYEVTDKFRYSSQEGKEAVKIPPRSGIPGYAIETGTTRKGVCWATRQTTVDTIHKFVCKAVLATIVLNKKVKTSIRGNNTAIASFTLDPGETVTTATVINVERDSENQLASALMKATTLSSLFVDRLHSYHLNWWKEFWLKSYVRMYDRQLENYYFGALYMTACSNREGNNPSPLHGPWNVSDYPNWKGNYKLTYNFQMTYSGVCSSNRPELLIPYMDIIFKCIPDARRRSESGYEFNLVTGWRWRNPDGSLKFPNGIKGGLLYPGGIGAYGAISEDGYGNMVSLGAWAAAPCIWYYNSTMDQDFLSEELYPFLKELAVFWETYLVKEQGKWVVKYSGATEAFSNDAINSSLDIAVVKYLFSNIIPMSETLGIDESKRNLWQDIVDNMSPLPTTEKDGKTIFAASENIQDKAFSSFVAYPGMEVNLSSDPKTKEIFKNSIDEADRWDLMNAPGYLWAVCAHGGYPAEDLLERFRTLLDKKMLNNNVVRGEDHGTESASSLEYINCSMMDSYEGFIRIFPSWPLDNAKFKRLRAFGAFLISAEKKDGSIGNVKIYSEKGKPCTVTNPWPEHKILIYDGGFEVSSSEENGLYTFSTIAGHHYTLSPGR